MPDALIAGDHALNVVHVGTRVWHGPRNLASKS
jgi:hypothetical protein